MAVTMALTATSHSITATVSGLDPEYAGKRLFVWFLDRRERERETIQGGDTTHTHTIEPVYFGSLHTVKCEIYNEDGTQLFITLTGTATTGYPSVTAWNWQASNGTASAMQTAAAYTALSGRGQTANMNYRVWNDLANKIHRIITESGIPWDGQSPPVVQSRSELMADDMNLLVKNVGYPLWSWRDDEEAQGYLARLEFRGVHRYGKQGDIVYGAYIIELAKNLNIIIRIYTNGERLTTTAAQTGILLDTSANAIARHSAPVASSLGILLTPTATAFARHTAPLLVAENIDVGFTANLTADQQRLMRVLYDLRVIPYANARSDGAIHLAAENNVGIGFTATLSKPQSAEAAGNITVGIGYAANLTGRDMADMLAALALGITTYGLPNTKAVKNLSAPLGLTLVTAADADAAQFVTLNAQQHSTVTVQGEAQTAQPLYMPSSVSLIGTVVSSADADISPPLPLPGTVPQVGTVESSADAETTATKRFTASAAAAISSIANMQGWMPPIQTGSNLFIRQAYDAQQDGTNLFIT